MRRIHNEAGAIFFPRRRGSALAEFVRVWVYPAGVLALWLTIAVLSLGQLITVEPVLRSIPDLPPRPARPLGAAVRPGR
jgi:hypothetical protein